MLKKPVFALLFLVFVSSLAAAQSPRAVPNNDDFASATSLMPGKKYTVKDIGAATTDVGQPGASCGSGSVYNSVWYSYTAVEETTIYVSTEGTQLFSPPSNSIDTMIAVYEGADFGSLVEVACNDDGSGNALFTELYLTLQSGDTIYIAAGTYHDTGYTSASFLRLNTSVTDTDLIVDNFGFEDPLTNADWKVKNSTGDDRVCNDLAYPDRTGICAFKFAGNTDEASKLVQTYPQPAYFAPRKNAAVMFEGFYRVMDATIGAIKVTFSVNYSDGTPSTRSTISLAGTATMASYDYYSTFVYLSSKNVASYSIKVASKSTTGVLLLDDFAPYYQASAATRTSGVLPLPGAPR